MVQQEVLAKAGKPGNGARGAMSSVVTGVASNSGRSLTPAQEKEFRGFFDDRAAANPSYGQEQKKAMAEVTSRNNAGDWSWLKGDKASSSALLAAIAGFEKAMRDGAPTV